MDIFTNLLGKNKNEIFLNAHAHIKAITGASKFTKKSDIFRVTGKQDRQILFANISEREINTQHDVSHRMPIRATTEKKTHDESNVEMNVS